MQMLSNFFHQFSLSTPGGGAVFMWVILLFFIVMVAIVVERAIYIYARSNINANRFMAKIRELVMKENFDKAIELCRSAGHRALPQVVLRAVQEAKSREFVDFRAVQNAVDEATLELIPRLGKRTGYLAVIGNISTLTGLLGTIYGLIISFEAAGAAGGGAEALAQGISVAMFTTLWGLIVAIPALVAYTIINTKANAIIDDIDEHSVKLIHLMTRGM